MWGDDFEPNPDVLEEPVSVDATPEELANALLDIRPPQTGSGS